MTTDISLPRKLFNFLPTVQYKKTGTNLKRSGLRRIHLKIYLSGAEAAEARRRRTESPGTNLNAIPNATHSEFTQRDSNKQGASTITLKLPHRLLAVLIGGLHGQF